jgi:hypothetical protein
MDEPLSSPPQPEEKSSGPWLGLGIAFVLIVAVVGGLIYSSRNSGSRQAMQPSIAGPAGQADPYAAKLQINDVHLLQADNMIGGSATYIEGTVTNAGDKVVTAATVVVTFKNSMGQVVQRQNEPLWIIQTREPAVDVATLAVNPLKPGDKREFRLSFERISADWDRQQPELRITVVATK